MGKFQIDYWLHPDNLFEIHTDGKIVTKAELDLESMQLNADMIYNMVVFASNGTHSTNSKIQMKIKDVNEFPPKFPVETIELSIPEVRDFKTVDNGKQIKPSSTFLRFRTYHRVNKF